MARPDFERAINAHPELKAMRRNATLATGGALLGLTTLVGGFVDTTVTLNERAHLIDQYVEPEHPLISEASQLMFKRTLVEKQASSLLTKHKSDEAREYMDSEEYQEVMRKTDPLIKSQEERDKAVDQVIEEYGSPTLKNAAPTLFSIGASFIAGYMLLIRGTNIRRGASRRREQIRNATLAIHPEWEDHTPLEQEIVDFHKGLQYLPPVGGKIPLYISSDPEKKYTSKSGNVGKLDPSWTAEEQVAEVNGMKKNDENLKGYVHQLTVQGRLPDRFKFAALALIMNSPYESDWTTAMFNATWGKVAPMIHDGGNVETSVNPLWKRHNGRTDFMQRVAIVHEPHIAELKELTAEERQKLPVTLQIRAGEELQEEKRLTLEAKFYQRAALALHSAEGTAPRKIPSKIRRSAAEIWQQFEANMRGVLVDYGIQDIAEVPWFLTQPRTLFDSSHGERHEADWLPIQEALTRLEGVKRQYPEMRDRIGEILRTTSQSVDQAIGLPQ